MSETRLVESPRLRFFLALALAVAMVVVLDSSLALQNLILPLQRVTASTVLAFVDASGLPISLDGIVLMHPDGFRVAISYGCTPIVPAIFIVVLLTLGVRLNWRERLTGLASGLILVTLLNLFRIKALYYIGVITPGGFPVAHTWLGQAITVIAAAAIVLYWINISVRNQPVIPVGVGS